MKRWIAILLAACLLWGMTALAEAPSKLPAPEEVAGLEIADETEAAEPVAETAKPETETAEPEAETAETDAEAAEPEAEGQEGAGDIAEAEPTDTPEPEPAEASEPVEIWFEEGFGLTLPGGWVSYAVNEEDRESGIRYALGDGSGARLLYLQFLPDTVKDIAGLGNAVENSDGLTKTGDLTFGGTDFVAFIDSRQNASCCATLWGGEIAVFIFTPQSDSDYMLTASQLMESFKAM